MAKNTTAPAGDKSRELPKFIKLQAPRGEWQAGRVVQADADLLSALDVEGVAYTPATDEERRLGGFVVD